MDPFEIDQLDYENIDIPVYDDSQSVISGYEKALADVFSNNTTGGGGFLDTITSALGKVPGIGGLLSKVPGAVSSGISGLLGEGSKDISSYVQNNAGTLTALLGLYSLMGGNKPKMAGYAGSIPKLSASREMLMQAQNRMPGGPSGRYMSDVVYKADGGYLRGATGGMADELDTTIDGEQPAKLSHGEFVIPADVVSHLGDGNSEAGAKKLYEMMDKVRHARTGKKSQAPAIKADKYMPKFKNGGAVSFEVGGKVPQAGQVGTSTVGTLAPWAGEYITTMLGKGRALAEMPYMPYSGALTPGASQLQQQAFAGLGALQTPAGIGAAEQRTEQLGQKMGDLSYTPGTFTAETFTPQAAQQYMNPYLQAALNPQLEEAKRQAEIQRVQQAGRLTKAGAYGGSRQAIMESELARNLGQRLSDITGQGYGQAYQAAQQAFQQDQQRKAQAQQALEQSRQYGAGFGLQGLQAATQAAQQQAALAQAGQTAGLRGLEAQMAGGATQRDIEAQGLAADYKRFQEERDWPYKMLQYQQSLMQGLPITATSYQADTTPIGDISSNILSLLGIYKTLSNLGQLPKA